MTQTTVEFVKSNNHNGKALYSFKGSDNVWYNTGTRQPPAKGSFVEFDAEPNAAGYLQAKNIVILPSPEANVVSPKNFAKSVTKGAAQVSKDEYWSNRESRDIENQKVISLQSCRNSAIALVAAFLQNQVVPAPKKADYEEFVRLMVDKYTKLFYEQNSAFFETAADPQNQEETVNNPTEQDASVVWE